MSDPERHRVWIECQSPSGEIGTIADHGRGVRASPALAELVDHLARVLRHNRFVVAQCLAGVGRSWLVAGAVLVHQGLNLRKSESDCGSAGTTGAGFRSTEGVVGAFRWGRVPITVSDKEAAHRGSGMRPGVRQSRPRG